MYKVRRFCFYTIRQTAPGHGFLPTHRYCTNTFCKCCIFPSFRADPPRLQYCSPIFARYALSKCGCETPYWHCRCCRRKAWRRLTNCRRLRLCRQPMSPGSLPQTGCRLHLSFPLRPGSRQALQNRFRPMRLYFRFVQESYSGYRPLFGHTTARRNKLPR